MSGARLWESTAAGKRCRHPAGTMISADEAWGDATSGGRIWTGMKRDLELGAEACEAEIRIQRRTDMGWTPMRAAKPLAERPDGWNGRTRPELRAGTCGVAANHGLDRSFPPTTTARASPHTLGLGERLLLNRIPLPAARAPKTLFRIALAPAWRAGKTGPVDSRCLTLWGRMGSPWRGFEGKGHPLHRPPQVGKTSRSIDDAMTTRSNESAGMAHGFGGATGLPTAHGHRCASHLSTHRHFVA